MPALAFSAFSLQLHPKPGHMWRKGCIARVLNQISAASLADSYSRAYFLWLVKIPKIARFKSGKVFFTSDLELP